MFCKFVCFDELWYKSHFRRLPADTKSKNAPIMILHTRAYTIYDRLSGSLGVEFTGRQSYIAQSRVYAVCLRFRASPGTAIAQGEFH